MSERGSFVTEYVNCPTCFEGVREVLMADAPHKYLWPVQVGDFPIIAGKIGALSPREELRDFEFEIGPAIAKRLCHPLRVAVLADNGRALYMVHPDGIVEAGPDER